MVGLATEHGRDKCKQHTDTAHSSSTSLAGQNAKHFHVDMGNSPGPRELGTWPQIDRGDTTFLSLARRGELDKLIFLSDHSGHG